MAFIRQDQADVYVTVAGVQYGDTWATYSGGALTAADAKTRSGGMGQERSLGGPASRSDVTVTIQFEDTVAGWHPTLESYVGRGDIVAKVTVQYLNPDKTPMIGASFSRTGTIKSAEVPATSFDTATAGFYTLIVSCDELAA